MVRKTLSEGGDLPAEFSRPEVVAILQDYYQNLEEKVEIKLHGHATGDAEKEK
jgi:sulfate adenylyltransferase